MTMTTISGTGILSALARVPHCPGCGCVVQECYPGCRRQRVIAQRLNELGGKHAR